MGQFAVVLSGVGGHGCSREIKGGGSVLGCQRPDCPDCIAREFVRRYKRNNVGDLAAELLHWPQIPPGFTQKVEGGKLVIEGDLDWSALRDEADTHLAAKYGLVVVTSTTVIDDLVTGVRTGSF